MPIVISARRAVLSLLATFALSACPESAEVPRSPPPPPQAGSAGTAAERPAALPDFTALVEKQGPAVVNVVTSRQSPAGPGPFAQLPDDPLFDFFRRFVPDLPPGGAERVLRGLGSGFIISPDGIILTNAHVVADADLVTIRLADGKREFKGKVLGADSRSDIAVVKIEASGLPVATLGSSAGLRPGQWVAAIGSPFGFENTITAGIVSAVNRDLPDEALVPFIQTDVAVNPGNSGGPLLNMAGQVIGINSMIYSGTGGYMGVSFAIPIEVALDVARQLQATGKVTRGRLGISIQPMTAELAQAFRLPSPTGVLVGAVEPGGPAAQAGLRSGDVILEYNGTAIDGSADLPRLVAATRPGSRASLVIWRNGARQTVTATVGEIPPDKVAEAPAPAQQPPADRLGLVVIEAPPPLQKELGIDFGLLVRAVSGAAAATPIRPGDVIVSVNQTRIASLAEFKRIVAGLQPGDTVALLVRRGEAAIFVPLKVPGATPAPGRSP